MLNKNNDPLEIVFIDGERKVFGRYDWTHCEVEGTWVVVKDAYGSIAAVYNVSAVRSIERH